MNEKKTTGKKLWTNISDWLTWWLSEPRLSQGNQRVFDRYYKSYKKNFPAYTAHYYAEQTREILEFVFKLEKPKILEVGCGCGTEALWFALCGASVTGIDISEKRLNVARERVSYLRRNFSLNPDTRFVRYNFYDLPVEAEFDLVWMEQTFHHIEPREKIGQAIKKTLKRNGHIIISETNAWNPLMQMKLFGKRGFNTIGKSTDRKGKECMYGRERVITPQKLQNLLENNGLATLNTRYYRVLPNFAGVDRCSWIERFVPGWLVPAYTHYNLIARKT